MESADPPARFVADGTAMTAVTTSHELDEANKKAMSFSTEPSCSQKLERPRVLYHAHPQKLRTCIGFDCRRGLRHAFAFIFQWHL